MKNYVIAIAAGKNMPPVYYREEDLPKLEPERLFYTYFKLNPKYIWLWNNFIEEAFDELEEGDYYSYTMPVFRTPEAVEKFGDKWLVYDIDREISTMEDHIKGLQGYLKRSLEDVEYINSLNA